MEDTAAVRRQCWDRAIHAYATAVIFERRAATLRRKTKVLTFLGVIGPIVVGAVVTSFGTSGWWIASLLVLVSVLGMAQLVLSVWSLVSGWDASLAYAQESASDNYRLSDAFQKLGQNPPGDLVPRFEILDTAYSYRSGADVGQAVSPQEKRYGHRVGMLRFNRPCPVCGQIPNPDSPTGCPACGK